MKLDLIYILIGLGTLICNAALIYYYIRLNKKNLVVKPVKASLREKPKKKEPANTAVTNQTVSLFNDDLSHLQTMAQTGAATEIQSTTEVKAEAKDDSEGTVLIDSIPKKEQLANDATVVIQESPKA